MNPSSSLIPREVFFSHILPHLEVEEDVLHGLNALCNASLHDADTKKDFQAAWMRNPHSTLLLRALEKKDVTRFKTLVQEYPPIVLARDGRILSELLWTSLFITKNHVFRDIMSLFWYSINHMKEGDDIITRNIYRFLSHIQETFIKKDECLQHVQAENIKNVFKSIVVMAPQDTDAFWCTLLDNLDSKLSQIILHVFTEEMLLPHGRETLVFLLSLLEHVLSFATQTRNEVHVSVAHRIVLKIVRLLSVESFNTQSYILKSIRHILAKGLVNSLVHDHTAFLEAMQKTFMRDCFTTMIIDDRLIVLKGITREDVYSIIAQKYA